MNGAQMGGAVLAGLFIAAIGRSGPGWALATCGTGLLGTVPLLMLAHKGARAGADQ